MDQAGDVGQVLAQVRCRAVQERRQITDTEARGVVLDLTEQRIATIAQSAANCASRMVVIQAGKCRRTRALTDRALTILCTQKAVPHQRDLG